MGMINRLLTKLKSKHLRKIINPFLLNIKNRSCDTFKETNNVML